MPKTPQYLQAPSGKPEAPPAGLSFRQLSGKQGSRGQVVLVMVDDDEEDCLLVKEALKLACTGCTFHCVLDGAEMMDYLNRAGRYSDPETSPVPDLILLDLNLPKMGGREVLRRVKTDPRFRAIPVIILTTSRELEDVKACYALGANSYITKLPSFDELVEAMKTLAEYWIEIATLPHRKARTLGPIDPDKLS
ncbi:MAG TPA: response regulator [Syntrophobacteraceae bacterium]|nr:response regulator [Syntrophobacteraceae bacterium]